MSDIEIAAIRLVMLERRHDQLVNKTPFTKEYASKYIEPNWEKIVKARKDLREAVERLRN